MISWLQTTTAAVSRTETYSSSASGAVGGSTTSSSSSEEGSYNWSETYGSSTAYAQTLDATGGLTVVTTKAAGVPNSASFRSTITATSYAQTSTSESFTIYPLTTISSATTSERWTTSTNPESETIFHTVETETTSIVAAYTETTISLFGSTQNEEQTVFDVPYFNTIYRAASEFGEVLFSAQTTDASAYSGPSVATAQSATRLTGSFNTETISGSGATSYGTSTNNSVTGSFAYTRAASVFTTLTVCSFAFRIPQQTRTVRISTRTTTASQESYTYFGSQTVLNPQQTTVWFVSSLPQSTSQFNQSFENVTTRLASVTRHTTKPYTSIFSTAVLNGASAGISFTTTVEARRMVTTYQDRSPASLANSDDQGHLRQIYKPFGRSAQNSVGAALSFPGIDEAFTVPSSSGFEAVYDREAHAGTSGSIFGLAPGFYTYQPFTPAGSASLSISGDSFSFTTASTESHSGGTSTSTSTTTGVAEAYGASFLTRAIPRPVTVFSNGESQATQAASLNLLGVHVIGGALAENETAVEQIPRGVWHNGSQTSFYQGAVTTRTDAVATTALVPLPYFYPNKEAGDNNLIWAATPGQAVGDSPVSTAIPLPF
jgi:hypothetical protein